MPGERELLHVRIASAADRCAVAFAERGAVGEDDYVRLALHYYARAAFELARDPGGVDDLRAFIDCIAANPTGGDCDVFALAGAPGSFCGFLDDPAAERVDCAFSSSAYHREFHLDGELSTFSRRALTLSVLAVIQAVLRRISPEMRSVLLVGLANMNASYGVTHRYSDADGLGEVPMSAYYAASLA